MKLDDFNLRNFFLWKVKLIMWLYFFLFAYKNVYTVAGLCHNSDVFHHYYHNGHIVYGHCGILEWGHICICWDHSILYALIRNGWTTDMALLISACLATLVLYGLTYCCSKDRIFRLMKRMSDYIG
ncbi:MAG: hypothetical protein Pg6B_09190 [Candidatus Azobacteroides pseudotrichonymphae]|jgi:hypothetical protein|nr:MAG: hypothetical protein Pg6B_09190 [Candidatus Azobacteroides pseudotrichonymphae]